MLSSSPGLALSGQPSRRGVYEPSPGHCSEHWSRARRCAVVDRDQVEAVVAVEVHRLELIVVREVRQRSAASWVKVPVTRHCV